jgi:hypothetical protein
MTSNRLIAAVAALALGLAAPATALANTCVNLKRPADSDAPLTTKGNWVNVGDAWLFISPGTNVEEEFGVPIEVPGESGNFTNGKTDSISGASAHCDPSKSPESGDGRAIQLHCH